MDSLQTLGKQPSEMSEPQQTTVMDPRGDVVLRVGPQNALPRAFLVNSRVLSLASPVFATMFNGQFAEGQGLSATTPRMIPLPEDNPRAMETLLNIAHMCADKLAKKMDHTHFADFAILCDKYDCIDTARMCSRTWATDLLANPSHAQFEKLVFTTYVLDLPLEFYYATQSLLRTRRLIKATIIVHDPHVFPLVILDQLNEAMLQQLEAVIKDAVFNEDIVKAFESGDPCDRTKQAIYNLFAHLVTGDLFHWITRPIQELKDFIPCLYTISHTGCRFFNCPCQELPYTNRRIENELGKLITSTRGLCLDCIRCEAEGVRKNHCRVQHE